jgi:hypothetical protein
VFGQLHRLNTQVSGPRLAETAADTCGYYHVLCAGDGPVPCAAPCLPLSTRPTVAGVHYSGGPARAARTSTVTRPQAISMNHAPQTLPSLFRHCHGLWHDSIDSPSEGRRGSGALTVWAAAASLMGGHDSSKICARAVLVGWAGALGRGWGGVNGFALG